MDKIINVAQYVFDEYRRVTGEVIDEMKLHKLLYFAQRESLAITNNALFEGDFEGWKYGPVCKEIRHLITPDGIIDATDNISDECKYTPVYNFINVHTVAEPAVLRLFLQHLILYGFRYSERNGHKRSVPGFSH